MRNRRTCALVMLITFISMCLGHGDYIYKYTTAQPAHYLVLPKAQPAHYMMLPKAQPAHYLVLPKAQPAHYLVLPKAQPAL